MIKLNKYIIATLWCLCTAFNALAIDEHFTERIEGPTIQAQGLLTVQDDKYFEMLNIPTWVQDFTNYKVSNKVWVGLNPTHQLTTDANIEIKIQVKGYDALGNFTVENRELTAEYLANGALVMNDLSSYVFERKHRLEIEIINVGGVSITDFVLQAEIDVERYYNYLGGAVSSNSVYEEPSNTGYLQIAWEPVFGAEEYELEYVHINDYTIVQNQFIPVDQLRFDFYRNSTRIKLSKNGYRLPNVYDSGYFIYRVRAIGRQGTNFEYDKVGPWNVDETGTVDLLPQENVLHITNEFDAGMNWSYGAGLTEDGKRFESISYVDGLGRGRQSITHNTETQQTVVSNVYYDYHGRPVISDLPTPTPTEQLTHRPAFNRAESDGQAYKAEHFDLLDPTGDPDCPSAPIAFKKSTGAGQYYSNQNQNLDGENAHIPDANGYPFSQVQYTQDQTGRPRRTGANGATFQLTNGRTSKFIYGTPSQEELNRLFGTEVGYKHQYQRSMMQDPNGQLYVTYTDLAGRTIASGMMGESPDNLEALANTAPFPLTETLLDGANLTTTSVLFSIPMEITNGGDYVFDLSFTPEQYTSSCLPNNVCFDCVYDLKFTITDAECSGDIIYEHIDQINGATFDKICNGTSPYSLNQTVALNKGSYHIERELVVSETAADEYWCLFLEDNDCVETHPSIFNTLYNNANFEDCETTDPSTFTHLGKCETYRLTLAADMSPNGQYGLYDNNNGVIDASPYPLSIFNTNNQLEGNNVTWQNPFGDYLDENGNISLITITDNGNGTYTPEIVATPTTLVATTTPNNYTIHPEDLLNAKDFIHVFEASWGDALLPFHPESCYLSFCENNTASNTYDENFSTVIEHNLAVQIGWYNPLGMSITFGGSTANGLFGTAINLDPFFTGPYGSPFLTVAQNEMDNYFSINGSSYNIWEYTYATATFPQLLIDGGDIRDAPPLTDCNEDQLWLTFRTAYENLKLKYYQLAELDYVMQNNCYNGCIGDQNFSASDLIASTGQAFNNFTFVNNTTSNPSSSTNQPCNSSTAAFYSDKQAIFQYWDVLTQSQNPNVGTTVTTGLTTQCQDICDQRAEQWAAALTDCPNITTGQKADIEEELAELCALGCDQNNLQGVSSLIPPTTTANGNSNFDEVLVFHLDPNYESDLCNIYLFSDLPPAQTNASVLDDAPILDECGCDILAQAEADFNSPNKPQSVNNIEEMLFFNTGIELEDIDNLLCLCKDPDILIAANLPVPEALSCDKCLSCQEVESAELALLSTFDNIQDSENYGTMLTNYMNQSFGYQLGETDYITFLNGCKASSTAPYCQAREEVASFAKVMNLLAKRGQLFVDVNNKVDLYTGNIVYSHGAFGALLNTPYYWSCEGSSACTPTNLTVYFGNNPTDAISFEFSLPTAANFTFKDIIGFGELTLIETGTCVASQQFEIIVSYLNCGAIEYATLTGKSNNMVLEDCYCGDDGQVLCDESTPSFLEGIECYEPLLSQLAADADDLFTAQISALYTQFKAEYTSKCLEALSTETITKTGTYQAYQFTLFYYDQAGNLFKTVAPEGVDYAFFDNDPATTNGEINDARDATVNQTSPAIVPNHTFETVYEYNAYGQLVTTTNPDQEGNTVFWYDHYGRIVASQNPKQADLRQYSYTFYDGQGRPVEVGQVNRVGIFTFLPPLSEALVKKDDLGTAFQKYVKKGTRTEVTRTYYDKPARTDFPQLFESQQQTFLRLRVASVVYFDNITAETDIYDVENYTSAIHYSYDEHGNVIESIQDVPLMEAVAQQHKSTAYEFELISGNVAKVSYQKGAIDSYEHTYYYDELNRLSVVNTSTDGGINQAKEAAYFYYDYGPMARTEIGDQQVQGTDYAYTINGWLKGINSNSLLASKDMGRDGTTGFLPNNTGIHQHVAKDVAGYSLGYYNGDYTPIGGNSFEAAYDGTAFDLGSQNLYNGNIRNQVTTFKGMQTKGNVYAYDQLQRLKGMEVFYSPTASATHNWADGNLTNYYKTDIDYDKNGNITDLKRNTFLNTNAEMDNFNYHYTTVNGALSNRLDYVKDNISTTTTLGFGDIQDGMTAGNYQYNKLGELTADASEKITDMVWRDGDHKLQTITRAGSTTPQVEFIYNPFGVRVAKIERTKVDGTVLDTEEQKLTYYAYDANGQVMSVYSSDFYTDAKKTTLAEQYIYGSARHGVINRGLTVYESGTVTPLPTNDVVDHYLGLKSYECTNHLGNVLTVISDRKTYNATENYFEAEIQSAQDYYPFGMVIKGGIADGAQPSATAGNYVTYAATDYLAFTSSDAYRYAFNGMEYDKEIQGDKNSYTTEFRQYDPRLGRWKSLDPLMAKYPQMSPYVAFNNNPVLYNDPKGDSPPKAKYYVLTFDMDFVPKLRLYKTVESIWLGSDAISVEIPSLGLSYTFTPFGQGSTGMCAGCGHGNYIGDFEEFKKDPVSAIYSGNFVTDQDYWIEAAQETFKAIVLRRLTKQKDSKQNNIVKTSSKSPAWLQRMRNGIKFQQIMNNRLKSSNIDYKENIRLVPENGKGNIKGNRTDTDALVRNEDGTFTIKEYKLYNSTALTKGQKAAKKHVDGGNGEFEVRSNISKWGLSKGDKIKICNYEVITFENEKN